MFFSPLQLSSRTKAKKEALPPKSKHLIISQRGTFLQKLEIFWESMRNPGKAWEIPGKHGKSKESMENPGKAWEIPGELDIPGLHGKTRESMENPRKSWERTENHRKSCEILAKAVKTQELLLKPGK